MIPYKHHQQVMPLGVALLKKRPSLFIQTPIGMLDLDGDGDILIMVMDGVTHITVMDGVTHITDGDIQVMDGDIQDTDVVIPVMAMA